MKHTVSLTVFLPESQKEVQKEWFSLTKTHLIASFSSMRAKYFMSYWRRGGCALLREYYASQSSYAWVCISLNTLNYIFIEQYKNILSVQLNVSWGLIWDIEICVFRHYRELFTVAVKVVLSHVKKPAVKNYNYGA